MPRSFKDFFPSDFAAKRSVWIYLPSHARYVFRPCYLPSFCHSNNDWSQVQVLNLLTVKLFPFSSYFLTVTVRTPLTTLLSSTKFQTQIKQQQNTHTHMCTSVIIRMSWARHVAPMGRWKMHIYIYIYIYIYICVCVCVYMYI